MLWALPHVARKLGAVCTFETLQRRLGPELKGVPQMLHHSRQAYAVQSRPAACTKLGAVPVSERRVLAG